MTVAELANGKNMRVLSMPQPEREISGAYVGDLLSWVMGRAQPDNAWITIMSNINVVAVASLSDVSCVILAEGVSPDSEIITTAMQKGINILSTDLDAFNTAVSISGVV